MILNAIYSRLSLSTELAAIVGDKIYAIDIPEKAEAPMVAFNAITNPEQTKSGYAQSTDSVEIIALSKNLDEAANIANLIANLFYSYRYSENGVVVRHSSVNSITRSYDDMWKEYQYIINITLNSKIT